MLTEKEACANWGAETKRLGGIVKCTYATGQRVEPASKIIDGLVKNKAVYVASFASALSHAFQAMRRSSAPGAAIVSITSGAVALLPRALGSASCAPGKMASLVDELAAKGSL
jgi:hypothetical protein